MGINYFYQLLIVAIRTDIYRLYKGPSSVLYRVIDIRYRAVPEYIHNVIKIPFHIPKSFPFQYYYEIVDKIVKLLQPTEKSIHIIYVFLWDTFTCRRLLHSKLNVCKLSYIHSTIFIHSILHSFFLQYFFFNFPLQAIRCYQNSWKSP